MSTQVQPNKRIILTTKPVTGYSNFKPVCFILDLRIDSKASFGFKLLQNSIRVVRQNLAGYYFPQGIKDSASC
jgi:hypothetical protein